MRGKKGKKLSIHHGSVKPKESAKRAAKQVPKGNSAPGPHWGHTSVPSRHANIKGL